VLSVFFNFDFLAKSQALGVRPLRNQKMLNQHSPLGNTQIHGDGAQTQFISDFALQQGHVQAHEPDTLAYEILMSGSG
jgi:hypothetical protein